MKTLYVTSFNKKLYEATGKKMIESFVFNKTEGDLLITYEDGIDEEIPKHRKFIFYNLEQDEWLAQWLKENEDIIPTFLGGKFEGEYGKAQKFNNRASQWFRKIVALNKALDYKHEYDAIIFIDSDTIFTKKLPAENIDKIFDGASMFYHLGSYRRESNTGIESGIIGFNLKEMGAVILGLVINKFRSGEFREYLRWDDGYVFRKVVEENPQIPTRDVANCHESNVVEYGPFADYIFHNKGIHWKKHGLPSMKGSINPE
tara:strand:+ start:3391 stop:4167 length:777 start_codon:yes stop_codon:yes gene_type:complete